MPNLDDMVREAKARDNPPDAVKAAAIQVAEAAGLQVVVPGEGKPAPKSGKALADKPTKPPKIVAKGEKVIPPPSKDELALCRQVCGRLMKSEDHFVSLSIELAKLREMVKERGENWANYCAANIRNPKTNMPYSQRVIRRYVGFGTEGEGDEGKVTALLYEHKEKIREAVKKSRGKTDLRKTTTRKRDSEDAQIFSSYFYKGKKTENDGFVTVKWTAAEYRNLETSLKVLCREPL